MKVDICDTKSLRPISESRVIYFWTPVDIDTVVNDRNPVQANRIPGEKVMNSKGN